MKRKTFKCFDCKKFPRSDHIRLEPCVCEILINEDDKNDIPLACPIGIDVGCEWHEVEDNG